MTERHAFLSRYLDVLGDARGRFLDSARTSTFTTAGVLGDKKWRSASVCDPWPMMNEALDMLCVAVDISPADVVDCQLTRSGDGDYFLPHYDNNRAGTEHRRITFVYYLGDRASFVGGRLRFPDLGVDVDATDDSMVFFPSGERHEIEQVRNGMFSFAQAARYTLNGWIA